MQFLLGVILSGLLFQQAPDVDEIKVGEAIRKGIQSLKDLYNRDLRWKEGKDENGKLNLVLWTMIHADVPEEDPLFQELLQRCLDSELKTTYGVALRAMILEELDRVQYQDRIAQCGQFLLDNQSRNGQWSYGTPTEFIKDVPTQRGKPAADTPTSGGKPVARVDRVKPKVKKRIPVRRQKDGPAMGDNSNSQYAALGIRACHDAGILFPREMVLRAKKWWVGRQNEDGGWSYQKDEGKFTSFGSMSAGAAGSVLIYCRILQEDGLRDKTAKRALEWIVKHFSVTRNPERHEHHGGTNPNLHYYYYMYALERVGIFYGLERLGRNWWYAEGAKVLLEKQSGDGSWEEKIHGNRETDTCFAILFLRRATRPLVESRDRRYRHDKSKPKDK